MFLTILALLFGVTPGPTVSTQQRALTPNMRVHNFRSRVLSQDRYILVWLPPGYSEEQTKRYPVLYLNDGQNKFINWRIDEIAQALIEAGEIEPLILVGLYHGGTHEDRYKDYTPTRDPNFRTSGNADNYGRMLVEEVKPLIDAEYRTLTAAMHTGIGGASLGGLVSMYLGLKYPTKFGKLALMSPSVWWDDKVIIKQIRKLDSKTNQRIWLDIGGGEGDQAVSVVKQLRDALVAKGWVMDSDLKYLEVKGEEHSEKAFARRADKVLKYLFPAASKSATNAK
ncbi:MAG TPA: alpha/beta hydrolase-fold protein [Pyrinomonadaceae bacterium]|nr:alpha/beta hydrolase-fold protein [Pyrinomonadaceae bacterium]